MKRLYLSRVTIGIATLLIVLFSVSAGRSLAATPAMQHMPQNMPQGQCQTSCDSQRTQPSQPTATRPTNVEVDEQNVDPQPIEPYYLAFIGFGWTTVITIAAIFLFKYLGWRPPDLHKLNAVYRF